MNLAHSLFGARRPCRAAAIAAAAGELCSLLTLAANSPPQPPPGGVTAPETDSADSGLFGRSKYFRRFVRNPIFFPVRKMAAAVASLGLQQPRGCRLLLLLLRKLRELQDSQPSGLLHDRFAPCASGFPFSLNWICSRQCS